MTTLKTIWLFLQNEILGMNWLNSFSGNILSFLGVDTTFTFGKGLQFFLYDTIKILILLSVLIFIITYIQTYFPPERTKKIIGKFSGITANIVSALLGTITPFCSCSSIPLFIGFTNAGLPMGVTFSFLISSPLVDLGSLVLLMSIFGTKIAVAYVFIGLFLAVVGGYIIEKLGMEKHLESFSNEPSLEDTEQVVLTAKHRADTALEQVQLTVKKVFPYIVVGVGIGALIHNVIPQSFVENVLGSDNPFSVVLATLIGVPMYADIFGTIPIAESLFAKGAGLGTVLSFMMAVTALSLPSMIMLRKVVKPKLLTLFIAIVTMGIIFIGYFFNAYAHLFI